MAVVEVLSRAGTIASGLVAVGTLLGILADWVTNGWVRQMVQHWLGISELRQDHHDTQTFLVDLGEAHNDLSETVCKQHDIPEDEKPDEVDAEYYQRRMDNGNVEPGDFRKRIGDD